MTEIISHAFTANFLQPFWLFGHFGFYTPTLLFCILSIYFQSVTLAAPLLGSRKYILNLNVQNLLIVI